MYIYVFLILKWMALCHVCDNSFERLLSQKEELHLIVFYNAAGLKAERMECPVYIQL